MDVLDHTLDSDRRNSFLPLAFGAEAIVPIEVEVPNHRVANFEEKENNEALVASLNFLEERQ